MSAVLQQIIDPRDQLERARRIELFRFARDNGVTEIVEAMPANLMRSILRSKGITNISVPQRPLGSPQQEITTPTSHRTAQRAEYRPPEKIIEVSAEEDLARQWRESQAVDAMNITEMRKECKRRGIKLARTDNMVSLKAKLKDGQ